MDNNSMKDPYDMMKDVFIFMVDDCKQKNIPIVQMFEMIGMSCWAYANRKKKEERMRK